MVRISACCTGRAQRKIRANQAEEAKAVYLYVSRPRLYVPRVGCSIPHQTLLYLALQQQHRELKDSDTPSANLCQWHSLLAIAISPWIAKSVPKFWWVSHLAHSVEYEIIPT